jgi:hypothetical protein
MSRVTSSGLSTVGSRLGHFGNGMNSDRKWRRNVLMNKNRNAEACCAAVEAANFLV